ncbi:MAG: ribosomal protein S18-alanine N-acetyltransferase [Candidatus Omnitrophota bacterium]
MPDPLKTPDPAPVIRRVKPRDIDAISQIETELFTDAWKPQHFIDELDHNIAFFYAAEIPGNQPPPAIAGYILFWMIEDTLELHKIAVSSNYQKKGIGKQLFGFMLEKAREKKIKELFLEVRKSNIGAIKLYESFGFNAIAIRKDYYTEPCEDAIIYQLEM